MDRLLGRDANALLQNYTDIMPGRPTSVEHRAPEDDLRKPYDRKKADPVTKLNALTILSGENQTHDYYMTIGPMFADPVARQLYAEIASIEEQHVTQYESIIDPDETWLEALLVAELTDNDAWQMLRELAQAVGQTEMAAAFQTAITQEREHLEMVRGWLKSMTMTAAGAKQR